MEVPSATESLTEANNKSSTSSVIPNETTNVPSTQFSITPSSGSPNPVTGMDVAQHDETIRTFPNPPNEIPILNIATDSGPPFKSFDASLVLNAPSNSTTTTTTTTSTPPSSSSLTQTIGNNSPSTSSSNILPPSVLTSGLSFHTATTLSPSSPSEQQQQQSQQGSYLQSSSSSMMISADTSNPNQGALVRSASFEKGTKYIDLTDYLALPQTEAARRLGIPTSTLSKRWKEAVVNRKWPYRMVCKLNKEIMTLLHNVPQGPGAPPLPPEIEQSLGILLRRRQEELRGVVIRV